MTPKLAQKKHDEAIKHLTSLGLSEAKYQIEKHRIFEQYLADMHLFDGRIDIFEDGMTHAMMSWHKALAKYETNQNTGWYLKKRTSIALEYQQMLVDVGLADRTFTEEEQDFFDKRSWLLEKKNPIVMQEGLEQEDACMGAFRVFRHWTSEFHRLHVPTLKDNTVVIPVNTTNECWIAVSKEEFVDPFKDIKVTEDDEREYKSAKAG